jgi:hypothetical protein
MTLTLPCDCDDEFWQLSPAGPGFQPPGTAPVTAFFISLINLYRIVHFTLRILVCKSFLILVLPLVCGWAHLTSIFS